jgi:predicted DNA binding CopG/RHH family protein
MKRKVSKKLPRFRSEAEESEFWASHDSTEYWDEFEDVDETVELDPELARSIDQRTRRKQLISIRLESWQIRLARAVAARQGIPYHTVIRNWVSAGIHAKQARR